MRSMLTIEIFRTDVYDRAEAEMIIQQLHAVFETYRVNFDLHDCDRILRIENAAGAIAPDPVIKMMAELGYAAELLY
jgi:hypothetical protein